MKALKYLLSIIIVISLLIISNQNNIVFLEVNTESNIIDLKRPSIITNNNKSIFRVLIRNNSDKQVYINNIEILVKDSENNIISNFVIDVNKNILNDENIKLEKEISYDLSNATSFDYIVN